MTQPGSQFLHERNPHFQDSLEVEAVADFLRHNGSPIPNEPAEKISAYLGFLADSDYANDGILTGDQSSIDRQIDAHVIKSQDVPESYFELQRRIAREQGLGEIEIPRQLRGQMIEALQADQRAGLGKWVEYLGGDDGGYPDWFKYYSWTSVVRLGVFDKERKEFQKRTKGTTAPYPELNREALAYVYDSLNKTRIKGENAGVTEDAVLQKLIQGGNFGKLYAHAVLATAPASEELRNEIRGSWTTFNQTNDPRTARRLSGSLQGHGTGWCTAGESTAQYQLQGGDFYVFYTRDGEGKDTIPRIAVRMENGEVAEVRGINSHQEMEPVMAETTEAKLSELPGGEAYVRKAEDMRRLTYIENMLKADPETKLSDTDLKFLYELDHDIVGFGYEPDPRITEVRALRGDRDRAELIRIIPETIRDQLKTSFTAYSQVAEQLSGNKRLFRKREGTVLSETAFAAMFKAKDKEWRENGIYDELVSRFIEGGARHTLVATPNIQASEEDIVALAERFGQDQPYSTFVDDDTYRKHRYTDRQWSGNSGSDLVKFSLIPSKYDAELGYEQASVQREALRVMQSAKPKLKLRVPSLADAITYWYTLRAGGDKLSDSTAFDKTLIRHFDLDPIVLGGVLSLPRSSVSGDGEPYLDYWYSGNRNGARVAMG